MPDIVVQTLVADALEKFAAANGYISFTAAPVAKQWEMAKALSTNIIERKEKIFRYFRPEYQRQWNIKHKIEMEEAGARKKQISASRSENRRVRKESKQQANTVA